MNRSHCFIYSQPVVIRHPAKKKQIKRVQHMVAQSDNVGNNSRKFELKVFEN